MSAKKPLKDYVFVGIQGLLFLAYLIPIQLFQAMTTPDWLSYAGLAILVLALVFGVLAFMQLSTNLSPYPTPVESGQLVTHGVFRISRHPIYTSLLFAGFGFAIYHGSVYKLLVTLLLLILFYFKSKYEEGLLASKYPEYPGYKKRTRRFI